MTLAHIGMRREICKHLIDIAKFAHFLVLFAKFAKGLYPSRKLQPVVRAAKFAFVSTLRAHMTLIVQAKFARSISQMNFKFSLEASVE